MGKFLLMMVGFFSLSCVSKKEVETGIIEEVIEDSTPESVDYDAMTKAELEDYGRSLGIELNKNKTRETLIAQLEEAKE